jgi:4-amino-4-deoxy-L-arabinose transferase-like glycosyltransferase
MNSTPVVSRELLARGGPPASVAVAFVIAAAAGWGRFGDIIVDTGHELDVPRRMLAGERLYCDVRFYYGPLAPWVNAFLYSLLGVRVDVLAAAGLVSAALLTIVLYLLARRFTSRVPSAAAAIAFIFVCALGSPCGFAICNFVLPHTFAATYGALAAAASLLFLVRHTQEGRPLDFLLACAGLALVALSKIEALAPALAVHLVFLVSQLQTGRLRRWPHAAGWAGTVAIAAAAYGALAARCATMLWRGNLGLNFNLANAHFIALVMGVDRPVESLRRAAGSGAILAAVAAVSFAAAWARSRARHPALAAALPIAAGGVAFGVYLLAGPRHAFRVLPAVMIARLAVLALQWWRAAGARQQIVAPALLWTFALVALGRIVLQAHLGYYGYYMLPVALVCAAVFLAEDIRTWIPSLQEQRAIFAATAAAMLCGVAVASDRQSRSAFADRTIEITSQRGNIRLPHDQREVADMVVALAKLPPQARLLVVPEGIGVNFFSGLSPADPFSAHLPTDIPDTNADRALLEMLRNTPPDYVVSINRGLTEYGYRGFGIDYAVETWAWIEKNYRPVFATHPQVVLRKRVEPKGRD